MISPWVRSAATFSHFTRGSALLCVSIQALRPYQRAAISTTIPTPNESPTSKLLKLAATITKQTQKLETYMSSNGIPEPSFNADASVIFPKLPEELRIAREEVIKATKELGDLVTGAEEGLRWLALEHNTSLSLRAIYHYNIAKSFPVGGTSTYQEIAGKVGLDVSNLRRLMRHAMTNRIFQEVEPEVVAHTAASKVLAEDQGMMDWVGFCVEDIWPAAEKTIPALVQYPSASEPNQSGFCVANGTADIEPMFATFGKSPLRAKRMGGAMTSLTRGEGYEISHLIDNYDWPAIDSSGGTIVDLGGSHGFVCLELANRFPNLKFVVQDLQKTISSAPKLDGSLSSRIQYMVHDFHTAQPVQDADVYFFRWIMHNHSDKYAKNMLNQLKPALKKGAKVLIHDYCLPDAGNGSADLEEKVMRTMDLGMLSLLNARERAEEDWRELFESVGGFKFLGVKTPIGSRMSLIEATWEG